MHSSFKIVFYFLPSACFRITTEQLKQFRIKTLSLGYPTQISTQTTTNLDASVFMLKSIHTKAVTLNIPPLGVQMVNYK